MPKSRDVPLLPDQIAVDPLAVMGQWIDEARATGQPQPTAMALATAGRDGRPSNRMVFLRGWGPDGPMWITDGRSRKAREVAEHADAAGVLFWPGQARQLRVEGPVHLIGREVLDAVFAARRPESRAAAWAWRQGEGVASRAELLRRLAGVRQAAEQPHAPPEWVGQQLQPVRIEFWQEDPDGLHDRLVATRNRSTWVVERLAP